MGQVVEMQSPYEDRRHLWEGKELTRLLSLSPFAVISLRADKCFCTLCTLERQMTAPNPTVERMNR